MTSELGSLRLKILVFKNKALMNSTSITFTHPAFTDETGYEIFDGSANPCLVGIPNKPLLDTALSALTRLGKAGLQGVESSPSISDTAHIHLPTFAEAKILIEVMEQYRESYYFRDLRDREYREYTINANEFINKPYDRHGYRIPPKGGPAPRAKSRGIFVCAPSGMGRRGLADAIEAFIGRGKRLVRVPVEGSYLSFVQLKTLRITWPQGGVLSRLVRNFTVAFDTVMHTTYSTRHRGPLCRDDDMVTAMATLASIANLGLLIVERINTKAATTRAASETWDALGAFTRTTGIPVLCLATPGAAIGLVEQSGSIGDLTASGVHYLFPPPPESKNWEAVCKAHFDVTLKLAGITNQPDWFSAVLWSLSLGHYRLAAKACVYVANHLKVLGKAELNEASFKRLSLDCLALEARHLQAAQLVRQGGTFKSHSIRRHGDWLPLELVISTVPTLELVNSTPRT